MAVVVLGGCGPLEAEVAAGDQETFFETPGSAEQEVSAREAITCIRIVSKKYVPPEGWTVRVRNECNGSRRYKLDIALWPDTSCRSIGHLQTQTIRYSGSTSTVPRGARDC